MMSKLRKYRYVVFFILLLFIACNSYKDKNSYLSSNNPDSLVIGYYLLETVDSAQIIETFNNPYDRRISFSAKYYGKSVYQAKMAAMERITGLTSPRPITSVPDTAIVEFYKRWVDENFRK